MGPDTVTCLANETLSGTPECRDIDECIEGTANCNAKSTACVNMPGGYYCQCRSGFKPQLGELGLRQGPCNVEFSLHESHLHPCVGNRRL